MSPLNSAIDQFLEKYSTAYSGETVDQNEIIKIVQQLTEMISEGSDLAKQSTYTEQLILNKLFLVMNNCLSLLAGNQQLKLEWKETELLINQLNPIAIGTTEKSNLASIATAALVAGAIPVPVIGIPVALGAGYVVDKVLDKQKKSKSENTLSKESIQSLKPQDYVSASIINKSSDVKRALNDSLSAISGAFSLINERIEKEVEDKENMTAKLQDVPDVLPFMQQFLGYIQSQKECPDNLEVLGDVGQSILNNQGIQIKNYDGDTSNDFNISYGKLPKDKNYRQMLPAFTVDDVVICKGLILLPENSDVG